MPVRAFIVLDIEKASQKVIFHDVLMPVRAFIVLDCADGVDRLECGAS